jgi:hypothetical protein
VPREDVVHGHEACKIACWALTASFGAIAMMGVTMMALAFALFAATVAYAYASERL